MNNTQIDFSSRLINRYTFIYSDPNNAGCCLVALLAYVLFCENNKPATTVYYICALSVSVVATLSVQALIAFAIVIFVAILTPKTISKNVKTSFVLTIVVAVIVILFNIDSLMDNEVARALMYRVENSSISTGGGRMLYWMDTIENALSWYNIFVGKGNVVDERGVLYLPHNGHLYIIISFGLLTNIIFCKTFFLLPRRSQLKYYAVLLPFFIAFTINTGVSDYRYVCSLALLSACVNSAVLKERSLIDKK